MAADSLKKLFFSQSALAIFNKCQRRFRYRYLDGLYWPAEWGMNEEIKRDLEQGRKFHLLAERYYSRTLAETSINLTDQLQAWLNRLIRFTAAKNVVSAEQELRLQEDNLKMLAKYDLLKYKPAEKRFIIYDWKTDKKSLKEKKMQRSMQSRFYLYLLFKAGYNYFQKEYNLKNPPRLIYWNPRYPKEKVIIDYDQLKFKADHKYFTELIVEIMEEENFELTEDLNKCRFCEYRPICRAKKTEMQEVVEEDLELNLNWESIEELEF